MTAKILMSTYKCFLISILHILKPLGKLFSYIDKYENKYLEFII